MNPLRRSSCSRVLAPLAVTVAVALSFFPPALRAAAPLNLGSRWELFVDEFLVASQKDVALKLHEPVRREIVLATDQPWEGPTSAYFSVIQDGRKVRLYYRGSATVSDHSVEQFTCVAESDDGIHFTRPRVGLIDFADSKENNIVWRGVESHNFAAFLDANPTARPDERYKALGGIKDKGKNWQQGETPGGLYAFASADGFTWRKLRSEPVLTQGAFDSQNLALWDATRGHYTSFTRIFTNRIRAIQSATSADFITWSEGTPHRYAADVPAEHFYTSATVVCPTAPHLFLSFPKRFATNRTKVPGHRGGPGVSDTVFMTSRDGLTWDRPFLEAWARPGPDLKNWTERSNMVACGLYDDGGPEWSLYISEHYRHPDHRIRRLTVRRQGFASMHAGARPGEFTTPPLVFSGQKLQLNYATSATGSVRIELQDESGRPLPGFALADMPELFGDEFDAVVKWKTGTDLAALRGKTIRLRVQLKDADLYALRFAD